MRFDGREINVVELWSKYVDFPPNVEIDGKYLSLVVCPNPDHDTLKRHFQINVEDGLVHCFAQCGISGTFSKAITMIEGCNEREARRIILGFKQRGNIRAHKREAVAEPRVVASEIQYSSYIPAIGLEYLASRKIHSNSIAAWEIGWDSEEKRIVIPAKDQNQITRFLIKRAVLNQNPKYLYAPAGVAKNSLLFGACALAPALVRSIGLVLVEGSLDAIRLYQHGFGVVATLGTGISDKQREIIARMRPKKIYTFFDRDVAGIHGIEIASRKLTKYPLYVCKYPKGRYDPAEMTKAEVERAISRAVPVSRFNRLIPNLTGGRSG